MHRQLGEAPYIVFLLCGMLPWQWTNASLRASMKALNKDSKLVRSTSLPREIWVLRVVASKYAEFVYALPVLAMFALITHAHLNRYILVWPFAMLLQAVLLTGCGLLLAPAAILYGDVERVMRIVTRLLFYFSPILYGLNDVEGRFGPVVGKLYILNPLAGLFDLYRLGVLPRPVGRVAPGGVVDRGLGRHLQRRDRGVPAPRGHSPQGDLSGPGHRCRGPRHPLQAQPTTAQAAPRRLLGPGAAAGQAGQAGQAG